MMRVSPNATLPVLMISLVFGASAVSRASDSTNALGERRCSITSSSEHVVVVRRRDREFELVEVALVELVELDVRR